MIRYFNEEDEINVDVQVGPKKEVEVAADPEEAVPGAKGDNENDVKGIINPIAIAKADPNSVPVAAIPCDHGTGNNPCCNGECKHEFFVDLDDVARFANLNEYTMLDALNKILEANEESGMNVDNLYVCCTEGDEEYAKDIDEAGGNAIIYPAKKAGEDIDIDVQVGPNKEELSVSANPQEANPVDAVKRDYNNVTIVAKDDKFFVDAEDVQKCADLNHESAVETLDKIADLHESMDAENTIVVFAKDYVNESLVEMFTENAVSYGIDN